MGLVHAATLSCDTRLELHQTSITEMYEVRVFAKDGLVSMLKLEFVPEDMSRIVSFFRDSEKKAREYRRQ